MDRYGQYRPRSDQRDHRRIGKILGVAELLRDNGYATYAAGKWHLAPMQECSAAGPHRNWPVQKGFDRFYGFLQGETDQFYPELTLDNQHIDPPGRPSIAMSPPDHGLPGRAPSKNVRLVPPSPREASVRVRLRTSWRLVPVAVMSHG